MQRVKAHELRLKDETACVEELQRHRKELASLRVSKVAAAPPGQARQSARRAQENCPGSNVHALLREHKRRLTIPSSASTPSLHELDKERLRIVIVNANYSSFTR